ncbi:MAG: L-serine ammonia-lyase [Planctomyces sp.]|nr:L-serine ammonia-lyase [Planctomyces sp.]
MHIPDCELYRRGGTLQQRPDRVVRNKAFFVHISVFDLFTIGIGPSSSHAVGPMRAAGMFLDVLHANKLFPGVARVSVNLYGSLALTGTGHGTDRAILMGLEGHLPETVDPDQIPLRTVEILNNGSLNLGGEKAIGFDRTEDLKFVNNRSLRRHPNGMRFAAMDSAGAELVARRYYSIGGGFVIGDEEDGGGPVTLEQPPDVPYPFANAAELLDRCRTAKLSISQVILQNELVHRAHAEIAVRLDRIWQAMQDCVHRGCISTETELPGGLQVRRRAAKLYRQLTERPEALLRDPLTVLDWVDLYALAVNEENAAGGRVVTAPTNGAAGIVPAVLHYYDRFCEKRHSDGIHRFLLTAGAIAMLYKRNASISGAEVGCQGEVGVACSMAAGALTEVMGGTPEQVEQAAEIGMEHNLGLTCDPVKGLVQVPCIERNAMGAVKAINAARLALRGDGQHKISLDRVIEVMRRTGADMLDKYKETSRGGLAVNFTEC